MDFTTATIKYLVFISNALCALVGVGVVIVNSTALKDIAEEARHVVILNIFIGSIVFLISFFGCCGAIKENIRLTWTYAVIMLIIMVLSCLLCFVYIKRINEETLAKDELNIAWKKNVTKAMSSYQTKLKCCGINSPMDYTNANLATPTSCYATSSTGSVLPHNIYSDGCLNKLTYVYEEDLKYVRVFSYLLIAVEGSAFLFTTILGITFNTELSHSRY